jgi:hypothetical protein
MKKNKIRHYETLYGYLFPRVFPHGKHGGETLVNEEPTLDEIWE